MLKRLTAVTAVLVAVVTAGVWAAAGAAHGASAEAAGGVARVEIRGYAFKPSVLTVPAGTTVTWTNYDIAPHTVTGTSGPQPFSSPQLSQGQSWSFTFAVPGTFGYYCAVHPTMTASVLVERVPAPTAVVSDRPAAPVAGSAGAPGASSAASPSAAPTPARAAPSVLAAAPPPAGARASGPGTGPSSRTLVLLAGAVMVVAVAGTLLVGGRTG